MAEYEKKYGKQKKKKGGLRARSEKSLAAQGI
jgi:hypothetical protein